jgi:hypothetical protein
VVNLKQEKYIGSFGGVFNEARMESTIPRGLG